MSSATALTHETRRLAYTAAGLLLVLVVVAGVLGYGDLFGLLFGAVQLAVVGVFLYLLYRFVLAVERIARALERRSD
jgi:hypothetical protein